MYLRILYSWREWGVDSGRALGFFSVLDCPHTHTISGIQPMPSPSSAKTWQEEIDYWARTLREDQLEFARLVSVRESEGNSLGDCYRITHPKASGSSTRTLDTLGYRMAASYTVRCYIKALQQEVVSEAIMGLDELRADLTIQVHGYEHLFDGYVEWVDGASGRIAFIEKLADIPEALRKYMDGYVYLTESEGYELLLRPYPGKESDRNTARKLLAQLQGGLIDKREVQLTATVVAGQIESTMSDDDAASIYKQVMRQE